MNGKEKFLMRYFWIPKNLSLSLKEKINIGLSLVFPYASISQ